MSTEVDGPLVGIGARAKTARCSRNGVGSASAAPEGLGNTERQGAPGKIGDGLRLAGAPGARRIYGCSA